MISKGKSLKPDLRGIKYRFEKFGGIIASESPPFLAFVDRQFMRELALSESPLWQGEEERIGLLSAPTEVHISATNSCPNRCRHCYMGSGEPEAGEMETETFKRALKELADWGVFHVALGGGEVLGREDLFELAEYARDLGLVPNLTISGSLLSSEKVARMTVFGQVNVSLDGVGPLKGVYRDPSVFEAADRAIDLLLAAGIPTGINCVIGRRNFEGLPDLAGYAREKGVNEIEFLRFKPAGRGTSLYQEEKTTYEENVRLIPLLMELSQNTNLCVKIDCSFVPMMCYHNPPREVLETTAAYGCEAANVLLGVRSDGSVGGCSFLPGAGLSVFRLRENWEARDEFVRYRSWAERAEEPCRGCDYLDICRGGCHAVAAFVTGSMDDPDPDCPWVVEYTREGGKG